MLITSCIPSSQLLFPAGGVFASKALYTPTNHPLEISSLSHPTLDSIWEHHNFSTLPFFGGSCGTLSFSSLLPILISYFYIGFQHLLLTSSLDILLDILRDIFS